MPLPSPIGTGLSPAGSVAADCSGPAAGVEGGCVAAGSVLSAAVPLPPQAARKSVKTSASARESFCFIVVFLRLSKDLLRPLLYREFVRKV